MSSGKISAGKQSLRDQLFALRQGLSPEAVLKAGQDVTGQVLLSPAAEGSLTVCAYAGAGKEVPTAELIRHFLMDGKVVVVPDWEGWKQGAGIRLVSIRGQQDLVTEGRIVPQPLVRSESIVPVAAVDLFIVPGLAFDRFGNRLGMGGGYFDRLLALASTQAVFFGLAHGFQIVDNLPSEPHDIPVHQVFTPGSGQSCGVDR